MEEDKKEEKAEKEEHSDYNTAEKFGIDLKKLVAEQKKLAKLVSLKDEMDFSVAETIAGCSNSFVGNKIISAIVVCNSDLEIIEQNYASRRLEFPYMAGFRAYRELPAMVECFEKVDNVPDLIFVEGHGITHPNGLGLASHFGIAIQKPTIGVAQKLIAGEIAEDKILIDGKEKGFSIITKQGSRPIYISPGHMISLKTSLEMTKKFLKMPHKLPEPLVLAKKYADKLREEFEKRKETNSSED